jgi:hypothetical protein
MRRGHWVDRLAHIDEDIVAMQKQLEAGASALGQGDAERAIEAITATVHRPALRCDHAPVDSFRPGEEMPLVLGVDQTAASRGLSVVLHYRHVNHGERWREMAMTGQGRIFHAAIPAEYSNSPYPLQYYFELRSEKVAWLYPALNVTLSNQPYYVVWKRRA